MRRPGWVAAIIDQLEVANIDIIKNNNDVPAYGIADEVKAE